MDFLSPVGLTASLKPFPPGKSLGLQNGTRARSRICEEEVSVERMDPCSWLPFYYGTATKHRCNDKHVSTLASRVKRKAPKQHVGSLWAKWNGTFIGNTCGPDQTHITPCSGFPCVELCMVSSLWTLVDGGPPVINAGLNLVKIHVITYSMSY